MSCQTLAVTVCLNHNYSEIDFHPEMLIVIFLKDVSLVLFQKQKD